LKLILAELKVEKASSVLRSALTLSKQQTLLLNVLYVASLLRSDLLKPNTAPRSVMVWATDLKTTTFGKVIRLRIELSTTG